MKHRLATLLWLTTAAHAAAHDDFAISVVDDATGRGVPLVELRTVDQTRYWTDSQGLVAFNVPGLMNQKVFFSVQSDGYEFPADGFGFRGKALVTTPGETAELRVTRKNLAERLYRVTGAGIYRDSVQLQREVPIAHPLLNAQVTGSDSVNSIVFQDRIFWFWGDTNRPAYPLGTFHVPGATSRLPRQGGLDPRRGVDLEYFTREDGFVASTCEMPGDGPTWIDGVCRVEDSDGRERLFAKYMKVRKFLEVYQRGLVEFDPADKRFKKVVEYELDAPLQPFGHSQSRTVGGEPYLYFGNPYPLVRVRANSADLADPNKFEAYTPLVVGSTLAKPQIERDELGHVRYGWKAATPAPSPAEQVKWVQARHLKPEETLLALRDVDSGKAVAAHAGTVAYNEFRRRYVMITNQYAGTSLLGEVWYAEADTPLGPWLYARKVVTHAKYSFYNPRHHPMFDQEQGRRIFFEGTYSTFMTGIEQPTPLYDYNQIMYSLTLDDPRLSLPVPIYAARNEQGQQDLRSGQRSAEIAFLALDRPGIDTIAIRQSDKSASGLTVSGEGPIVFYALPPDVPNPPATTVKLVEWQLESGARWYGIEGQAAPEGFARIDAPLARVWRYPLKLRFDHPDCE